MGILKRLREVEQAVSELQVTQHIHGLVSGQAIAYPLAHPIQPPVEQDECKMGDVHPMDMDSNGRKDKCKTCGGVASVFPTGDYGNFDKSEPCPDCQPKEDKKYYCVCGAKLELKGSWTDKWEACCDTGRDSGVGFHIFHYGYYPSKAALIAELEKMEAK